METGHWQVGIYLFNEVEVLDFAGPFEVFSVTQSETGSRPFAVKTVSEDGNMITARNGLKVYPDYSFTNMPEVDILLIPGGLGARTNEVKNSHVIDWVRRQMLHVQLMASVCTGSFLLAQAGVLNGRKATTHWASLDRLEEEFPGVSVQRQVKYCDEGNIVTSGGISAGIDMSFHIVNRLLGAGIARQTAKRMEYDIKIDDIPAD